VLPGRLTTVPGPTGALRFPWLWTKHEAKPGGAGDRGTDIRGRDVSRGDIIRLSPA
jgi:hypothetical protein